MTHIEFERAITQCCVPMIWLTWPHPPITPPEHQT